MRTQRTNWEQEVLIRSRIYL